MNSKKVIVVLALLFGSLLFVQSVSSGGGKLCFCFDEDAAIARCNQWCGLYGSSCNYVYPMYPYGCCIKYGEVYSGYCSRAFMMICLDGSNMKDIKQFPCPSWCGPIR